MFLIFINYLQEEANEIVQMGGGPKALLTKLDIAFEEKKYKWSLKLCDALLNINAEKSKATVKLYNFWFRLL